MVLLDFIMHGIASGYPPLKGIPKHSKNSEFCHATKPAINNNKNNNNIISNNNYNIIIIIITKTISITLGMAGAKVEGTLAAIT